MAHQSQTSSLFPQNLGESDWSEFEASGFSTPVTGIVYRDGSANPGMPLGGLGTGFIALGTDGSLDYYSTIFNAHLERHHLADSKGPGQYFDRNRSEIPSLKKPFLGINVANQSVVLSSIDSDAFSKVKHVDYWGHYPIADLEFEADIPLNIGLRAFSPFLPGDSINSNTPGAIFEVFLRNSSTTEQNGTIAFSFHGPRQEEMAFNAHGLGQVISKRAESQHQLINGDLNGIAVNTKLDEMTYSYVLATSKGNQVNVGGEIQDGDWNHLGTSLPSPSQDKAGSSVAVGFSIAPGESQTIPFFLSWYAPIWRARGRYEPTNPDGKNDYRNMYASRFNTALEVAQLLQNQRTHLLERIIAWQEEIYKEKTVPGWLHDSLINVFAVLPQQSFWSTSLDPNHWWGDGGLFSVNESLLSCPQQCCIANDEFGEWPIDIFFPTLGLNKLRAFKHYQRSDGQTPSTLGSGSEPDQPWYDQQLTIDCQVYIHMVDRLWQSTGDIKLLKEFYTSVKSAITFMRTTDADKDGLPDVKGNNQYYDQWESMAGAAIHISGYWLATLLIAERMADKMGDQDFGAKCRTWFKKGSDSLEKTLWNPSAGSYLLYHQPSTGIKSDSVLADQLIGEYFTKLHGLESVFPQDRVGQVLDTIMRINVGTTSYGVRVAMLPDGSADTAAFYSTCIQPSYSSHVPAALLSYRDQRESGEEIMRRIWNRLVVDLKMHWDMPGGLDPNGDHRWGLEYYHNTMLWTLPIALMQQNLGKFCGKNGLANRIITAAKL